MPSPTQWFRALAILGLCLALVPIGLVAQEDGEEAEEPKEEIDEVIVVTASRTEQKLHEVPASITVLSSKQIDEIPSDDFGDLLRNVPGLNVSQMSARDIVITGRSATNSLASSELVLLDGRTLYLDFFGFVMWDFMPVNTNEIKQVEVVRGPGSAVWGANAMSGVINLITKTPREMVGSSVIVGAGEFGTAFGSFTHAAAGDKVGYKVSAGYYEQDPYDRPSGLVPGTQTPYPPFTNTGTSQPKFDLRVDYDAAADTYWSFGGGYAGTDGIIHSGLGPFDINTGSQMSYLKADWSKLAMHANFFVNLLDGDAANLLTVGPDGQPLQFLFESQTYNLDFGNTVVAAGNNIITYGANARQNSFDLSLAPAGDERQEFGVYAQDEILIGDKVRWLVGARYDNIDPIGGVVSPRTSLLISPNPRHTFRASFNRAFQAPSLINNFLDITIVNLVEIPLSPVGPIIPVVFTSQAVGNPDATEEKLDAFEIGYVGTFANGASFTAAVYRNETTDSLDFFTSGIYTSANPPLGFPLPAFFLDLLASLGSPLPSQFSYRNIGEVIDQGVELSFNMRPNDHWSMFANYSWQDEPDVSGIDAVLLGNGQMVFAVNQPPENRANFGLAYDADRYFLNGNVNYVDDAFWTDVLDSRFWGPTDAYTQLSLGGGLRFNGDKAVLSFTAQNVFDEDVQQHVFGDIISRKISAKLQLNF